MSKKIRMNMKKLILKLSVLVLSLSLLSFVLFNYDTKSKYNTCMSYSSIDGFSSIDTVDVNFDFLKNDKIVVNDSIGYKTELSKHVKSEVADIYYLNGIDYEKF